jgi:outer membrane lipoprotein-sorting protein
MMLFAAALVLATGSGVVVTAQAADAPSAVELIRRADAIMFPDAKAAISLHSTGTDGRGEEYGAISYARDRNQRIIVRMTAPPSQVGNDLLMIEQNVWAYDRRANRVMKVPSNQSFGGTGFSYGDVIRLNFSNNYHPVLKGETEGEYLLDLTASDRNAPYSRIELSIARKGGWPVRGICYARNGSIVKEIRYSGVKDVGTGMKPVVLTVTSPLEPGAVNVMTVIREEAKDLPPRLFNKRNLETRLEEKL